MDRGQDDRAWFSGHAGALAQALVDARSCASACEALLESGRAALAPPEKQRLLRAIVLLGDRPPLVVLAAALRRPADSCERLLAAVEL